MTLESFDEATRHLRFGILLDVVHRIVTTQFAVLASADAGNIRHILVQTRQLLDGAGWQRNRRGVERRNALAVLETLLHPALLHAARKGVIVPVVLQFDLVRKDALALSGGELPRVLGGVGFLHRDEEVDGEIFLPLDVRPEVPAGDFVVRVDEDVRPAGRFECEAPLFVCFVQEVDLGGSFSGGDGKIGIIVI